MYSQMTVPKRRSSLEVPCASALATITNTSTGAMPFRAPTNRLPNSSTQPAPGTASASTAPTARPMTMRRIRLVALYLAATACNVFITFPLPYPDCTPIAHSFPIPLHGTSTIIRLAGRKVKDFSRFFWFLFQCVLTGAFSLSAHRIQFHKKRPHPVCFGMRSVPVLVEIGHLAGHKALNAHAGRVGDGDVLFVEHSTAEDVILAAEHRAVKVDLGDDLLGAGQLHSGVD